MDDDQSRSKCREGSTFETQMPGRQHKACSRMCRLFFSPNDFESKTSSHRDGVQGESVFSLLFFFSILAATSIDQTPPTPPHLRGPATRSSRQETALADRTPTTNTRPGTRRQDRFPFVAVSATHMNQCPETPSTSLSCVKTSTGLFVFRIVLLKALVCILQSPIAFLSSHRVKKHEWQRIEPGQLAKGPWPNAFICSAQSKRKKN